jgi:hypothetical protein
MLSSKQVNKQTCVCVCVCVCLCARLFFSRQNASSRFENRSVLIYTNTKKLFFVFGNDKKKFDSGLCFTNAKTGGKKKALWYRHRFKVRDVINKNPLQFPDCCVELRNAGEGF